MLEMDIIEYQVPVEDGWALQVKWDWDWLEIIEYANEGYTSPVVLVKKIDGSIRFCINYRSLNEITKNFPYPIAK